MMNSLDILQLLAPGHACSHARHPSGWRSSFSHLWMDGMWKMEMKGEEPWDCGDILRWWFYGGFMDVDGILWWFGGISWCQTGGCILVLCWFDEIDPRITFKRHLWGYRHMQDGMQHFDWAWIHCIHVYSVAQTVLQVRNILKNV